MATLLGIVVAGIVFFYSIYIGTHGNYMAFIDLSSVAIVVGGTFAATFICFPLNEVLKAFNAVLLVFMKDTFKYEEYINEITTLAKQVREVKSYDKIDMSQIKDPFLRDGIQMLKDAIHSSSEIQEILETRIMYNQNRENAQAYIFSTMSKLAPAFGMLGTLIGLIDMLGKMGGGLGDIGVGMAVALITTFYGAILSNLIFTPVAEKLKRRTEEDVIFKRMIVEGIVLLNEFQHPFVVEDRLNSYVPAKKRQDSTSLAGVHITLSETDTKEEE